jgi:hypothetical protein
MRPGEGGTGATGWPGPAGLVGADGWLVGRGCALDAEKWPRARGTDRRPARPGEVRSNDADATWTKSAWLVGRAVVEPAVVGRVTTGPLAPRAVRAPEWGRVTSRPKGTRPGNAGPFVTSEEMSLGTVGIASAPALIADSPASARSTRVAPFGRTGRRRERTGLIFGRSTAELEPKSRRPNPDDRMEPPRRGDEVPVRPSDYAISRRGGLVTFPARRQLVQTWIRLGEPSTRARTRWMLGSKRRFVRRWEWLSCIPNHGFFPQSSQTAAMTPSFLVRQVVSRRPAALFVAGADRPGRGAKILVLKTSPRFME